ncbi:MAG: hypothetical protein LBK05_03150 [Treponema sp.]|jgi:hypothetical protein|nr:hypothetical protein [Treponema sp.]
MENEKNPSIYDDRSAIGSSEELDEYGVWVKSGPQDISEEFQGASGNEDDEISLDLSRDFSLSANGKLPDFADFPGAEDAGESGGGGLGYENPEDNDAFDDGMGFETTEDGDAGEEDMFIDIDIPADTETGETMDFGTFSEPGTGTEDTPAGGAEISFEEINPGIDGDLNHDDLNDGDLNDDGLNDEDLNFEDIANGFPEESSGQAAPPESESSETIDDFEIDFGDSADFPEIPEEEPREDGPAAEAPRPEEAGTEGDSKVSTQLLFRIVNELSSIKSELAGLKKEIAATRGEIPQGETGSQAPGGFFDEADDEKIALTGAEMDNIINTASFTGEAESGGDEGIAEAQDGALPASVEVGPESGEGAEASPFEEAGAAGDIPGLPGDFAADPDAELSVELPAEFSIEDSDVLSLAEEDLAGESAAPVLDTGELSLELPDDTGADITDITSGLVDTEILPQDIELPLDGGIIPDSETSDLDLDANLSLDFPPEDDEEKASALSGTLADDSFAQLIPEGYEEKAPELPPRAEDSLEEEDIFDAAILSEEDILDAGLTGGDISAGVDTGKSAGPDSVFDLGPEPDEDILAADIEIPEISLDLDAEFDAAVPAAEDDITIDIPADTEGGEEPVEFDFTEEPFEALDEETLNIEDLTPAEQDSAEEEALPDIVLDEEPAVELPPEDESLPAEFGDFSIEALEDIQDAEVSAEPVLEAEEEPVIELPLDGEDESLPMDIGDFSIETEAEVPEDILDTEIPAEPVLEAEEEPVIELPLEDGDEPLPVDFDDFLIETEAEMPEDIPDAEVPAEPAPEAEEELSAELPLEDGPLSPEFDEFTIETETPEAAQPVIEAEAVVPAGSALANVPEKLREELKSVLAYMDQLLESLPEEKIEEFAKSEYFDTYKKLFEDLGLV